MDHPTPKAMASTLTLRFFGAAVLLSGLNYVAHLFPISLIELFGWRDMLHAELPNIPLSDLRQAMASFEFFFLSLTLLFLAELLAVLVVLREGVRLCVRGRDGLAVKGSGYFVLFVAPFLAAGMPLMALFGGPEAFTGTRAAGVGIHILMFVTAFLTAGVTAFNVGYALEPEVMQRASDTPPPSSPPRL